MSHSPPSPEALRPATARLRWKHWLEDRASAALFAAARLLPYPQRIAFMGWIGGAIIAPLAGIRRRIRDNLALVSPDMPEAEIRRLCRAVPDNMARAMSETFYGDDFVAHARNTPIEGEGWPVVQRARDSGQPVVLVTAHFGNYDAARVALREKGCTIAAFYMPMRNPAFNTRYVDAMAHIAEPIFPRDRAGLAGLLRHLRGGGMIALVVDQYMGHGELIEFMGQPARTALSPAEIALKNNALLIPGYAIRQPDGISFRLRIEAPVPHTDALTMTRALNASVEAMVRAYPEQWMWSHRRWKKNRA